MKRLFVCAVAFSALAIGTAAAADLPAKMHTKAPIMDPPYNWTGAYVGLNAGYSWGNQSNTLTTAAGATVLANSNSNSLNGFIGGGQVGYNWQVNQWVLGLEADFQGSAQTGSGTFFIPTSGVILVVPSTSFSYTDNLDWFGTVRGRLGWAQQGRWLPYVTGGWAYGHSVLSGTATTAGVVTAFSGSNFYSGWTFGAGVEWAFANKWSAKAEYLYIDFGNGPNTPIGALIVSSGRMTDNIARLGVNYKF